jgi:SAM-dependent methyltransferase
MTPALRVSETLAMYATASESYWRAFELQKLDELRERIRFVEPVLEIGCGNGAFTSRLFKQIDDAVDIDARAVERARRTGTYLRVHHMDAGQMSFASGAYGTVFANCVLEHIPTLAHVLAESFRVLRPGGMFLATVPLVEMNNHLLLRSSRYAELRRNQLSHVNLFSHEQWIAAFRRAGFAEVQSFPYLFGRDIAFWDVMDFPASLGTGRYRVSTALNLAMSFLPEVARSAGRSLTARWLARRAERAHQGEPCAMALVATKGKLGMDLPVDGAGRARNAV